MSDKKIGVLGGSGEIGKRCVNILTEKGYTVMASYRTRKPIRHKKKNGEITNESCYNVWWK